MATFSDRLRELRQRKSVSQQELADYLGVNKQTISGYERGVRRPSGEHAIETLEALADYFNVDLAYLLGTSDTTTRIARPAADFILSSGEMDLVIEYRNADEVTRQSIKNLLEYSKFIRREGKR